jgi:glycosyltransferase involved in cell wall biosynthesis
MVADLSVIIPTFNRSAAVSKCIAALEVQTVDPSRFEVVIVDDGSTDDTGTVARAPSALSIRYERQENAGANTARNRAIEIALAPILLFINDDTIADPRLIEAHLEAHARAPDEATAVLGRMTIHPDHAANPFSPLHHDASYALLEGVQEAHWSFFFTCNVSVKAAFLRRAGRFDPNLRWHEDIELGERLAAAGMRLLYRPDALGLHWHGLDERQYLRIAEREAASLVVWRRKRPDLAETLHGLGLVGAPECPEALRHRLANLAFGLLGEAAPLGVARLLGQASPGMARAIWKRVFQFRKRAEMARLLAQEVVE